MSQTSGPVSPLPTFLADGSETSNLIAARDWSGSLGPIAQWPQSLKTTVSLMQRSKVPLVLLWGADGIMLYNDAYSRFAGGRHPQLLGSKVREGWPEVASFNDNVMKVGLAGGTLAYADQELTLYRFGKPEQVWMNLDYSPVIGEDGAPAGVIAIVIETTARVQAERRSRQEQQRQLELFEQAPGFLIAMRGPDHIVEFVNRAHRRLFGSKAWPGKTIRAAFPDIADQGFFEELDKVYRTGTPYHAEGVAVRYRRSPGDPEVLRYLTFIYTPTTGDDGNINGVFCEGFDVTETHRLQEKLLALNETLESRVTSRTAELRNIQSFYTHSSENHGIMVEREDGRFEYVEANAALLKLYNLPRERIIGYTVDEILPAAVAEQIYGRFREAIRTGQPVNYTRTHRGSTVEAVITTIPTESGERPMVAVTARDISDRQRLEEQLRQAQKMEAIGQLTGGIAHDFNNLLGGLSGSLELMSRRLAQGRLSDVQRFIDAGLDAARRAASLTQRLLAFSRRQTLDPRMTDINQLIAGMEELIRRSVGPSIGVDVVRAGDLWLTKVDASQMENSLLNLCINARDAMMPAGGKLTIQTANRVLDAEAARLRELRPGEYVMLSVTDTGVGIPPDVVARIFDPFFTTKPIGQGTGLGLSMVHGFVRQSEGQIRVQSTPGQGTIMCLYLPRHMGEMDGAAPAKAEEAGKGAGETILVVDDERTIRLLVREVLEEAGYSVIEAADGAGALRILQSGVRIDLLVTDVGLPGGLNGRQVADAARVPRPDLKVLFITGFAEQAVVAGGHLAPGMEVVTKPFDMGSFVAKVKALMER